MRTAGKVTALIMLLVVPICLLGLVLILAYPVYVQSSNVTTLEIFQTNETSPPLGYVTLQVTFTKQDLADSRFNLTLALQTQCNQTPLGTFAYYEPTFRTYSIAQEPMQQNDTFSSKHEALTKQGGFNASYQEWEGILETSMDLQTYEPASFPLDVYETPNIIVAVNAAGSNSTNTFIMEGYELASEVPPGFSATISDYKQLSDNQTMSMLGNVPNLTNALAFQFKVTFLRTAQSLPLLLFYLVGPLLGIWCIFSVTEFRCDAKDRITIFAGVSLATFVYLLTFRNSAPPTLTSAEIAIILLIGAWGFIEMVQAFKSKLQEGPATSSNKPSESAGGKKNSFL